MRFVKLGVLVALAWWAWWYVPVPVEGRSAEAHWPLPGAVVDELAPGFQLTRAGAVYLFELLRAENPRLRFGIHDSDVDDTGEVPRAGRTTAWAWRRLEPGRRLLAVFNGPFFGLTASTLVPTAPTVEEGRVRHAGRNPRWTLGLRGGRPFLEHEADRSVLESCDFAAGNVQALIVEGRPLRIPEPGRLHPVRKSPPSGPDSCGPYPWIDHLKVARTSVGWKGERLAVLLVTQAWPEGEPTSFLLRHLRLPQRSGWDLADLQQFWSEWGAEGACSLDGGLSTQATWRSPGGLRHLSSNSVGASEWPVLLFPYVWEEGPP